MGIHDGHRKNRLNTLITQGIEGEPDHAALELLLFYCIHGKDVNPLAHRLVERFGSLTGVLEAPYEELMQLEDVGKGTAAFFVLLREVQRRYRLQETEKGRPVNNSEDAGKVLVPHFFGERNEVVYLLCLDAKRKPLSCQLVGKGEVGSAAVSVRRIVEVALTANATQVILAHNHPSGIALPSQEDICTTTQVSQALKLVGVTLLDHLIVADTDFVSLQDNGVLRR
ncbi:MAG: JAB domain-containing protein [bacterium]